MKLIFVIFILVTFSAASPLDDCRQQIGSNCNEVLSDDGNWGTWRGIHHANENLAYSMEMRVEGRQWGDDTAANGLRVWFRDMFSIYYKVESGFWGSWRGRK